MVGDVLFYEIHEDNDGKKRAVNASIEGVAEIRPTSNRRNRRQQNKNGWFSNVAAMLFLIALGFIVYNQYQPQSSQQRTSIESMFAPATDKTKKQNFTCQGKIHCSQMSSCEEASFYLRNCPGVKIDGDGDGRPCERQC